jgi:UDP-3-O-[3-hydroxymyristoyl] glucosamine N-acyltransferase
MKLPRNYTLSEIAALIRAKAVGDPDFNITGINEIHRVEAGDISFVDHPKYYDKALKSAATTIIINKEVDCPEGKTLLISEQPFRDYNFLTQYFRPLQHPAHARYVKGMNTVVGPDTIIYDGVVIGNNCEIGNHCVIHPNTVIYDNTIIGNNVVIHANTTIGGDAFYFKKQPEGYEKMYSCGRVIIHDHVEIGCSCTIDRGVSADTIIGEGTKLDNLIQIGHDTTIGKRCIIASQSGIAGVTTIEDDVIIWAQVGISKDLTIGKGAIVLAKSGVGRNLEPGKSYFGAPAKESRKAMRELATLARLANPNEHKE